MSTTLEHANGKEKSKSSSENLEDGGTAVTALAGTENSNQVNLDAEESRPDAKFEDKVDTSAEAAENEIDEIKSEDGENAEAAENDAEKNVVGEINCDNLELEQNTDEDDEIDGQEHVIWEYDQEYSEEHVVETAVEEDDVSGEDATEEEKDDEKGEEEEETEEEHDENEDVATDEDNDEETDDEEEDTEEQNDEETDEEEEATEEESDGDTEEEEEAEEEENDGETDKEEVGMEGEDDNENEGEENENKKQIGVEAQNQDVGMEGEDDYENEGEDKESKKQICVEAQERNTAKLKVIVNSAEKQKGKLKKEVQAGSSKKVDSNKDPETLLKRKVKKKVKSMGMIFMCNSKTKKDCYQYMVLGLPESKKKMVEKIYTGMRLFLYDVDLKLMYGIYKAAGPGGYNIEAKAFKSQFPSQVRFRVMDDCLPLPEEKFKKVIKDNYFTKNKFDCLLTAEQVKKLCKLFMATRKSQGPKKLGRRLKSAADLPAHLGRNNTRRVRDERRPALKEELQYSGRSRKRTRKIITDPSRPTGELHDFGRPQKRPRKVTTSAAPLRQPMPAPLPSAIGSYAYERTLDVEAYRRDKYIERRDLYRDLSDPLSDHHDPYRGRRNLPRERIDQFRDARRDGLDLDLECRDPYRVGQESYLESRYPARDERDPYLERHDLQRERRDTYLDRRDPYRDVRDSYSGDRDAYRDDLDAYIGSRDPYRDVLDTGLQTRDPYRDVRDGRDSYLERRDLYRVSPHSESHSTYRREPLPDRRDTYREPRGFEYPDSYRQEVLLGRHRDLRSRELGTRRHHEIGLRDYVSYRDRPSYAESTYSAGYHSRTGLTRKYHL